MKPQSYSIHFITSWKRIMVTKSRLIMWFVSDLSGLLIAPVVALVVAGGATQYTKSDIFTYYFVTIGISMMAISYRSRAISSEILSGVLTSSLTRPESYLLKTFATETSYRVFGFFVWFFIFLITTLLFRDAIHIPTTATTVLYFALFVVGVRILSFLIEVLIGGLSFWFGQTSGLRSSLSYIQNILAGKLVPLTLLPVFFAPLSTYTPFQYLFFIPSEIWFGRISGQVLWSHAMIMCLWILFLGVVVKILWFFGLRQYDAPEE